MEAKIANNASRTERIMVLFGGQNDSVFAVSEVVPDVWEDNEGKKREVQR